MANDDYYQPAGGSTSGDQQDDQQTDSNAPNAAPNAGGVAPSASGPADTGGANDANDWQNPTGSAPPTDDKTTDDKTAADTKKNEPIADTTDMPTTDMPTDKPADRGTTTDDNSNAADTNMTPPEAAKAADNPQEAYNVFVEALIKDLGFDKVDEPQKSKLIDAIKQRVEARVLRTLMTSLTKEQSDEINKEIEEKGLSEDAIVKLLTEKAPNASAAILSALDDLYMEMKEETDLIWKAAGAKAVADVEEGKDDAGQVQAQTPNQ